VHGGGEEPGVWVEVNEFGLLGDAKRRYTLYRYEVFTMTATDCESAQAALHDR